MTILESYDNLISKIIDSGFHEGSLVSLNREAGIYHEYPNTMRFVADYMDPVKILARGGIKQHFELPIVTEEERSKIYETEKYERSMILNDLKFSTHIMMSKYNEPATSRRFVATNDSCLSFVQVTITKNHFRWVFVSRSTEVNKMLPADLLTIGTIMCEWTNWFRQYIFQKYDPSPFIEKKVNLVLFMNNPHYYK